MTTGQKICECRRKMNLTQEELADKLGVSRQAVSKWEADVAFPETEKILELCKMFSLSADELLFGETRNEVQAESPEKDECVPRKFDNESNRYSGRGTTWGRIEHEDPLHFEYISKTTVHGTPLFHINFGLGAYRAKGIVAIGNVATGVLALGFVSAGVFALGLLSIGLFAFGSIALALLLGAGGVATGALAFGGVAIGILTFGGCSIGYVAIGGYAVGQYALGGVAHGHVAVGVLDAEGTHAFLMPEMFSELEEFINENLPASIGRLIKSIARSLGKG